MKALCNDCGWEGFYSDLETISAYHNKEKVRIDRCPNCCNLFFEIYEEDEGEDNESKDR